MLPGKGLYNYKGDLLRTKKIRYLFTIYPGCKYQFKVRYKTLDLCDVVKLVLNEFCIESSTEIGVFMVSLLLTLNKFSSTFIT